MDDRLLETCHRFMVVESVGPGETAVEPNLGLGAICRYVPSEIPRVEGVVCHFR